MTLCVICHTRPVDVARDHMCFYCSDEKILAEAAALGIDIEAALAQARAEELARAEREIERKHREEARQRLAAKHSATAAELLPTIKESQAMREQARSNQIEEARRRRESQQAPPERKCIDCKKKQARIDDYCKKCARANGIIVHGKIGDPS